MSSIFLHVLRHKDFFGWVTSLHGENKVSNFFFIIVILDIFKKTSGFFVSINRLWAGRKRSGRAICYVCAFSILRNRHKACSKMSGAHYGVIILVKSMLISSILVLSLTLNQSKVFLTAQGFLSKKRMNETLL